MALIFVKTPISPVASASLGYEIHELPWFYPESLTGLTSPGNQISITQGKYRCFSHFSEGETESQSNALRQTTAVRSRTVTRIRREPFPPPLPTLPQALLPTQQGGDRGSLVLLEQSHCSEE